MNRMFSILAGAWVVLAFHCSVSADWPSFRGPHHNGISAETGFKKDWKGKIPQLWERNLGSGFSSFAAVGDRIYTAGTKDKQQTVYALNANTGEVIWEKPFEAEYPERQGGDGPRATPTIDGEHLYILGAKGKLVCLKTADGSEVWSAQYTHMPTWGYSGSVLIEGNMAVSAGGDDNGALIAYDKLTGKVIWKTGEDPAGYATPYPFTFEGTRYIFGFTGNSALIVEAATGRLAWRQEWITDYAVNAAAPIFHNGHLFLGSGYQTGAAVFKLSKEGERLKGTQVWKSKVLMNKFQSAVLHDGHLYASDQRDLKCVNFLTGEEIWKEKRVPNGTVLLADGQLIVLTEKGELQIAPATPKGYVPTTSVQILDGRCWTLPVLHEGKLYARDLERMVCLDMK